MAGAGAGGYAQMGTALSGDIVGGIGGLIQAQNYHRPRLPPATGYELRLRQLAQNQLLGGGQQMLGATALYNQLAPILMGQLPGLHYVPGSGGTDVGAPGTGAATSSPMANYQHALAAMQQQQALVQQRTGLRAQRKGAKGHAAKKGFTQQIKDLNRQINSLPTAGQLERQESMGATQTPMSMYNVQQGPPDTGGMDQQTLGQIQDLMRNYSQGPSLLDVYQQRGGY